MIKKKDHLLLLQTQEIVVKKIMHVSTYSQVTTIIRSTLHIYRT